MNGARPIEALPRYPTKYRLFGMALLCYVGSLVLLVLSQDQSSSAGYLFAAGALLIPLAVGFAYFDVKARAKLDKEVHPQEFAGRGYIGVCAALLLEVMLTPLAFLEPRDAERLFLAPGEAFVFVLAGLAVPYFLCVNQVFLMNDQIAIVKEGKLFWSGRVSDLKGIWLGARFRNVAGLFVEYVIFQTAAWPHPRIGNADIPPAEYRRLKKALGELRPQYPRLNWRAD